MNAPVHKATHAINATMTEDMERDIAACERRHQYLAKSLIHLADGSTGIDYEADCLRWFKDMEALAKRIATSEERPAQFSRLISGSGRFAGMFYKLTSLGEAIWTFCHQGLPLIEEKFPTCRRKERHAYPQADSIIAPKGATTGDTFTVTFNPHVWLILKACQRAKPVLQHYGGHTLNVDQRPVREALDRLVNTVRKVCRSKRFQRIEANRLRSEKKNLASACQYVASRFAKYSCLLVMRVDLYFRPHQKAWSYTPLARTHIRRFLRALSESRIVPDVKAWICKCENGPDRGMHYHLLVAMDGHKHREALSYSRMLGEAWQKRCGRSNASYFNCYVRRDQYKYNCLGLVRLGDRRMLMGIREAIKYMVKGDGYVLTGRTRNLWRGTVGRMSWRAIKRGAPRKAEHDMSLVNEILGGG